MDPDFGKIVPCGPSPIGLPSGAIGSWGEDTARNFLAARGIFTVKHAVFRMGSERLIADLFDVKSLSVYE